MVDEKITGKILRLIRDDMGMTLEEMAAFLGTSKQVLSRYERGERAPKLATAMEFARKLNVSLEVLAGLEDPYKHLAQKSAEDRRLLAVYHQLNPDGRRLLLTTAESYAANPALTEDTSGKAI